MVALEELKPNLPKTHYLKDYKPSPFFIDQVHLHFELNEQQTLVRALLQLKRHPQALNRKEHLFLDGEGLTLEKIAINGRELKDSEYQKQDHGMLVYNVPDAFELETQVTIHPQKNTELSGLYQSHGNFCTQCEPQGFRRITYFLDRPDVMTRFTTTISADKQRYPMLLSNGNLVESKDLPAGRYWVKWEDPSLKPCYLFALVAGDFDVIEDQFTTLSHRVVKLVLYLEKGSRERGHYAMQALIRSMRWDEQTFGREYDLDIYMIVAVSDFNMGAMENKGLNIFNTRYVLVDDQTSTDNDYFSVERVIGHEYFHNWSGNRITCRDWFQITLKEGLTVLREQLFCEDMTSESVVRIQTANMIRSVQFDQDEGPMSHSIRPDSYMEINNFYTVTVYEKGAEVIRMIRTFLGKELFRKAMDLYFSRYDGQAVTTEDFIQAMQDASGKDLTQFCLWYQQSGTPELTIKTHYDAGQETYQIRVSQGIAEVSGIERANHLPLHMPLAIGLMTPGGEIPTQLRNEADNLSGTRVLDIHQMEQTFTFVGVKQQPTLSLLRGFSAPVKCHYDYTDEQLLTLIEKDTDAFGRWNAIQQYWGRLMLNWADQYHPHHDLEYVLPESMLNVISHLLASTDQDLHLLSLLLTLPTENYLMQLMSVARVDAIHQVYKRLKYLIGITLEQQWQTLYQRLDTSEPYHYHPQAMAERSLKAVSLSYLVATGKEKHQDLAYQQFRKADNMTDTMAALCALNPMDCLLRYQALREFYQKWQHEALVMDKWLALEASAPFAHTLERVKTLMQDKVFDRLNPNKIRALLGTFSANLFCFHHPSGRGYQFLADKVLEIDTYNRLTAARIGAPLIRWQKVDTHRQSLMKRQLERIIATPNLSTDVYEMVSKSLV